MQSRFISVHTQTIRKTRHSRHWALYTVVLYVCNTTICMQYYYMYAILLYVCNTTICMQYYRTLSVPFKWYRSAIPYIK